MKIKKIINKLHNYSTLALLYCRGGNKREEYKKGQKGLYKIRLRLRTLIALGVIAVLAPIAFFTLYHPGDSAEAAWWNDGWQFRKRITVTNNESSDLTDYQVSFTMDTASAINDGKMQAACQDIRITDTGGNTLPYWIEENNPGCDDANTKIWVKVANLPADGADLFVYYGNPSASAPLESNGEKVFSFFDDFSGSSLDTSKWHLVTLTASYNGTNTPTYLYIDGKLVNSNTLAGSPYSSAAGPISAGVWVTNNTYGYFPGQIDDVQVYNYALSASQVKKLYNQNSAIRFGE